MLGTKDTAATIPVKDLEVAKRFYQDTLGLTPVDHQDSEAVLFKTGNSRLLVYRSDFAGTNKATAATWDVGNDVEREVETLRSKGVKFEHYDMPDMRLQGDVHVAENMKAAWFKDPDGNILAIVSQ
jgi:catechol 2,3-dioxygenase-like lactoylglutathione lyase family enzyme